MCFAVRGFMSWVIMSAFLAASFFVAGYCEDESKPRSAVFIRALKLESILLVVGVVAIMTFAEHRGFAKQSEWLPFIGYLSLILLGTALKATFPYLDGWLFRDTSYKGWAYKKQPKDRG